MPLCTEQLYSFLHFPPLRNNCEEKLVKSALRSQHNNTALIKQIPVFDIAFVMTNI